MNNSLRMLLGLSAFALVLLTVGCTKSVARAEATKRWNTTRAEMATRLGEGCFQRGEFGRAREHIEECIRNGAPYAPMYVLAARLSTEKGDLDMARTYAENAKAIDPKSAEARYVLGTIEQTLGHGDIAFEEYAEAARLDPKQPKFVLAAVELLVAQGKADIAAQALDEAATQMPGRWEIYAARGDVLSALKRDGEAVGCYRIAIRLEPNRPELTERLATALFCSGAYAEAEPKLAELAECQPAFATGWVLRMRAECLLALNRPKEARSIYQGLVRAGRAGIDGLVGQAKCDLMEGRLASAEKFLAEALARDAQHVEANGLMGYVLVVTGKKGEAVPHLTLAMKDEHFSGRATVEKLLARAQQ